MAKEQGVYRPVQCRKSDFLHDVIMHINDAITAQNRETLDNAPQIEQPCG